MYKDNWNRKANAKGKGRHQCDQRVKKVIVRGSNSSASEGQDYCNRLLIILPAVFVTTPPLPHPIGLFPTGSHMIFVKYKSDHLPPLLKILQQLLRMKCKLLTKAYNALNDAASTTLSFIIYHFPPVSVGFPAPNPTFHSEFGDRALQITVLDSWFPIRFHQQGSLQGNWKPGKLPVLPPWAAAVPVFSLFWNFQNQPHYAPCSQVGPLHRELSKSCRRSFLQPLPQPKGSLSVSVVLSLGNFKILFSLLVL